MTIAAITVASGVGCRQVNKNLFYIDKYDTLSKIDS